MELKDYKKLLDTIHEELKEPKNDSIVLMPLIPVIKDISGSLTNASHEQPQTYRFDGKFPNMPYRLTLKFDDNIENIFTKSNRIDSLNSMGIEYIL